MGEINVAGLIGCFSKEEFDEEYKRVCSIWKTMPIGFEFIQYIDKYKKQYMKKSMLTSVRERCSPGSPPIDYNCNESINSMIKWSKRPQKLIFLETVQLLKKEVNLQEEKVKVKTCSCVKSPNVNPQKSMRFVLFELMVLSFGWTFFLFFYFKNLHRNKKKIIIHQRPMFVATVFWTLFFR